MLRHEGLIYPTPELEIHIFYIERKSGIDELTYKLQAHLKITNNKSV